MRTHRIPGPAYEKIAALYVKGWTAAAISKALEGTEEAVHFKTVQRILRELRERDAGHQRGPWSLGDAEDDEARLVLPVWGAMVQQLIRLYPGPGRPDIVDRLRIRLSVSEARWIVRVRRAAPDLPLDLAAAVATAFDRQELLGRSTQALDEYLAFAPWRGERERAAYEAALQAGLVREVDSLLYYAGSTHEYDIETHPDADVFDLVERLEGTGEDLAKRALVEWDARHPHTATKVNIPTEGGEVRPIAGNGGDAPGDAPDDSQHREHPA